MKDANPFYPRIIPRALFDQANLMRCYGEVVAQLAGPGIDQYYPFGFYAEWFDICRIDEDDALTIDNLRIDIGGKRYRLKLPLVDDDPWGLVVDDEGLGYMRVFDAEGKLSAGFVAFVESME